MTGGGEATPRATLEGWHVDELRERIDEVEAAKAALYGQARPVPGGTDASAWDAYAAERRRRESDLRGAHEGLTLVVKMILNRVAPR